jgi:hypothetical protein
MSNQALTDDSWKRLAKSLEVEAAALRAVAAVEAAGSGFLPNDPARPKILFEGHAFHRLTGGRFATQRPDLSYVKWDRTKYSGTLKGEWARLEAACNLDRAAALQAASWGMFQIMGFNYAYCGCPDDRRTWRRCKRRTGWRSPRHTTVRSTRRTTTRPRWRLPTRLSRRRRGQRASGSA